MPKPVVQTEIKVTGVPSLRGLMADMAKWGVVFDADANPGVEGDPEPETKKPETKKKAPAAPPPPADPAGPSKAEAEMLDRIQELSAQVASYEGATPAELKELRALKAKVEKEAADRAKAEKEAEKKRLEEEGKFEELKRQMAVEHEAEVKRWQAQVDELQGELKKISGQVIELNVGSAFAASKFIAERTVYTPAKARKIFGDHFEVVDGRLMAYMEPKGAAKRTPLVDARGNPLDFDTALERIVEADPDRDTILRSKTKPGAGVAPSGTKAPAEPPKQGRGREIIAAGIGKLLRG